MLSFAIQQVDEDLDEADAEDDAADSDSSAGAVGKDKLIKAKKGPGAAAKKAKAAAGTKAAPKGKAAAKK